MAKIRKSSVFSKFITTIVIFLTVLSLTLAIAAFSTPPRAFAADFGTGDYSAVGQTELRTTYQSGSGAINGQTGLDGAAGTAADDFNFVGDLIQFGADSGNNSVGFDMSGLTFVYSGSSSGRYTLQSNKKIAAGSMLYKALTDTSEKYDVRVHLDAQTEFSRDQNSIVETQLSWDNGSGETTTNSRKQTQGGQISFDITSLTVKDASRASLTVSFGFPKENDSQNTAISVKFSNIRVSFIVSLKTASYEANVSANISGENRMEKSFSSTDQANHYVKSQDSVVITLGLKKNGEEFVLGSAYKEIFSRSSAVVWKAELKVSDMPTSETIANLDRFVIAKEDDSGQTYRFDVPDLSENDNGRVIVLTPSLNTDTSSESTTLAALQNIKIVLTVDSVKPKKPQLTESCDLTKYFTEIAKGGDSVPYVTNSTIGINWTNETVGGSRETMYYTVKKTNWAYDVETPTVNSPTVANDRRYLDFFPNGAPHSEGSYAVALMFIDEAGNVSETTTFDYVVYVDDSDYAIYARAKLGLTGASSAASGASEFGTFRFNGNQAMESITAKRGEKVSLVYSFSNLNLRNYYLSGVYNANNAIAFSLNPDDYGEDADPKLPKLTITTVEETGRTVYTISFIMERFENVDFISSNALREFTFIFKRRIYPNISGTRRVFQAKDAASGTPQTLSIDSFYYWDNGTRRTIDDMLNGAYQLYYGKVNEDGTVEYGSAPFSLAGNYRYKIELRSSSENDYYCLEEGDFIIEKAAPGIVGFEIQPPKTLYSGGLPAIEFGSDGGIGLFNILSRDKNGGLSDAVTSIGLRGRFKITNMATDSNVYRSPNVGKHSLSIVFIPEDKNSENGVMNSDNYAVSANITAEVVVVKKDVNNTGEMVFLYSPDGSADRAEVLTRDTEIYYNGTTPSIFLNSALLQKYGITAGDIRYEYRVQGGDYGAIFPVTADIYNIRATISDSIGSYTGTVETTLEIKKQRLNVVLQNEDNASEFVYGYFEIPSVRAHTLSGGGLISVAYTYRYKAIGENDFTANVPQNAGTYQMEIAVLDQNYEGTLLFDYVIRPVRNGDAGLTINNPMPQTRPDIGAQLRYGMPLSELVLSVGSVVYRKADGNVIYVSGNFMPCPIRGGDSSYVPTEEELLLSSYYSFNFAFTPTGSDSVNFEVLTNASSVDILPAIAEFSEISIPSADYGLTLTELLELIEGKATYSAFNGSRYEKTPIADGVFDYVGSEFGYNDIPTVGVYSLPFRFRAADGKSVLYRTDEFRLTLNIERNKQELYVVSEDGTEIDAYSKAYGTQDTVAAENVKTRSDLSGLEFVYRYYQKFENGVLSEEIADFGVQKVGEYYLEISVKDENYSGSVVLTFTIKQFALSGGTNVSQYPAALNGLEWGVSTKEYESLSEMFGSVYRDDAVVDSLRRVDGTFSFEQNIKFDNPSAGQTVALRFIPSDTENYKECVFDYVIPVNKRTVAFEYNKESIYNAEEQSPVFVLKDNNDPIAEDAQKTTVEFLNGLPITVGSYEGIVKVSEDVANYRGEENILFTILPQTVSVVFDVPQEGYEAGSAVMPDFKISAEGKIYGVLDGEVTVTFFDHEGRVIGEGIYDGSVPSYAPIHVGAYSVEITVGGNHEGSGRVEFALKPTGVTVDTSVVVTYLQEAAQKAEITPIRDGYEYRYSIAYRLQGTNDYIEEKPKDVGLYEVRISLDENGYRNVYDLGVRYTVTQLEVVDFTSDAAATFVYGILAPNITFTAYGAGEESDRKLNYELTYYDGDGDSLAGVPAHAGNYTVEATLNERNYFGSARFSYRIVSGAEPRNVGSVETKSVYYKEEFPSGTDGVFAKRGTFRYEANGSHYEVEGIFTIVTEGFSSFGVGVHGVMYEFRATSAWINGGRYDILDGDIEVYRDVTDVAVVKRTLVKDDFVITSPETDGDGSAVTVYDETQKEIKISAVSAFFSPKEARDLAANAVVTYRNVAAQGSSTTAKPSAAGEYEVVVTIKHDQYDGSFEVKLKIEKAKPSFVSPKYVKKVAIGEESLIGGEVITSAEPLYAYYAGKKGAPIAGTFRVKNTVTFEKANLQAFEAVFTPDDTDNVQIVDNVTLYVYVVAAEQNRYEIKSEWFASVLLDHYGLTADVSKIVPKSGNESVRVEDSGKVWIKTNNGEISGAFAFNDANGLSDVGNDLCAVYFVPDENAFGQYQIVSFYIPMTVKEKAVVRVGEDIVYATVSAGATYASAVFSASLAVISEVSGGVTLTPPSMFAYTGDFDAGAIVPSDLGSLPTDVRAIYVGGNNFRSESDTYQVRFVYEVKEAGILADRLSYQFHLNPELAISVENHHNNMGIRNFMGISFSGTGDTVPDYTVTVEAVDVPLVDDATYGLLLFDVGVYRVTVTILKTSGYHGERTFLFEITKRDIGAYITVNGQSEGSEFRKTYLESMNFLASASSPSTGNRYDADYKILYREKDGTEFTESEPVNAGNYVIRAEVDDSDRFFGYCEFNYEIRKKNIVISQSDVSYTYGNEPVELLPRLDENVNWSFEFTDENDNVLYNVYPENAGEYSGRVYVNDPNYQGSSVFFYTVYAAQVTLTKLPEYFSLRYGQKLSEAAVKQNGSAQVTVGGKVLSAEGRFDFTDPDAVLDSGTNTVEFRFTPENKNYESLTGRTRIEVLKASVTVSIDRTEFRYDGTELDLSRVYTIYPSIAGIIPTYEIRRNNETGELVQRILEVGTYYVVFTVDTVNYYQKETAVIRMLQGTADEVQTESPKGTSLIYGQSLKNSALTGGAVKYNGVAVNGTFRYVLEDATADKVGNVEYPVIFTPNNANYAVYTGYTVTVVVEKAPIEILVSGNECVYGQAVPLPTFTVSNIGGTEFRFKLEPEFEAWLGKVMPAGTISTKVTLDNEFYSGEKDFVFTVKKKSVEILFYTDGSRTETTETYQSVHGENFVPYPGLNPNMLVGETNLGELNARILVEYRLSDGTITKTPPKNAGDSYYVVARYVGQNYNAQAEIRYTVNRAKVAEIRIDSDSLNKQIYGMVTMPNVVTVPAGVSYELDFGGGQGLPSLAGSYHLKVVITDPNYERTEKGFVFVVNPKAVTIENITVYDKIYDGVAKLQATGTISGLQIGDEVTLTVNAETAGAKTDPGEYGVVITSVKLGGRHAANYVFETPIYTKTVKIYENKIVDTQSGSYIVFPNGTASDNLTVEFKNAVSSHNKEGLISSLLGQKAQVVSFNIKSDGIKSDLSERVKVYVKIPDRFKNAKNMTLEGLGALADTDLNATREGDYMTFYTARSGEVVFVVSDFPYGLILVAAGILVALFGIFAICMFEPVKKRRARMYKLDDGQMNGKRKKK